MAEEIELLAHEVARIAQAAGLTVAVAESLTGGGLSQELAKAPDAGEWFAGGLVAYLSSTKFRVLRVPEGPVVTPEAARAMALGVLELTGADVAVAVTGVGGPGEEEGEPPGTVFMCAASRDTVRDFEHRFEGEPAHVVAQTIASALGHLAGMARDSGADRVRSGSADTT